jgi:hypothetical protein
MNRKLFRTIFLPGVIFLFSALVLGQSAWACDEPEHGGYDDHDKGGCGHPDHQCHPRLVIQSVDVDLQKNKIFIYGENFNNGDFPVVTLGGIIDLEVEPPYTGNEIVAKLSEDNLKDIKDSDYRLVVSTGRGKKCRDRYSLTIAGPSGTCTCPPGTFVTVIVTAKENEFIYDDSTRTSKGTASCAAGEGYRVTGGGFSVGTAIDYVIAVESKPVADGTGWELVVKGVVPDTKQPPPGVMVFAVCGKVQ